MTELLKSGDVGILIALASLLVIVSAIAISKDSNALGKHLVVYTLQLGLILATIWAGYALFS